MAYLKHLSCLASLAAVAAVVSALPAQAGVEMVGTEVSTEVIADAIVDVETIGEVAETGTRVEAEVVDAEAGDIEIVTLEAPNLEADLEVAEDFSGANAPATSASILLDNPAEVSFQISEDHLLSFNNAGLQATLDSTNATLNEGIELAQASRRGYGSISPAYLGVGGNLGFGDPDSAIGDFAFNVISKVSLSPRFSLRPGFFISERFTNFAVPLTYNFNTTRIRNFLFQPYVGAGVDVPFNGNTALMLNAGADVPISRDFTLNGVANFRVTSGFGVGISLGVGYNFPFIFE